MASYDFDVIVVGSGFGGSVSALRLTEKGYRVAVLEAGRRFAPRDFPATNWRLRRFLWAPGLGCRGIQRIHRLDDVMILAGAGVGGGSLVYANTLYAPLEPFYHDPQWGHVTDWQAELEPFFDQARRMLGVTETPFETRQDAIMKEIARRLGVAETYHRTAVGVYFGEPEVTGDDPFFGGEGPPVTGCNRCGGCMVGCRFEAKNTLDRNYLYLAEKSGAVVHPDSQVVDLRPLPEGGYELTAQRPGAWLRRRRRRWTAHQVVFSAGALGTLKLLFELRHRGRLAHLSPRLGELVRTNSEAIVGAVARRPDPALAEGIAITSSIHPDAATHIEPCRYSRGSNAMGLLATILVDGGGRIPRQLRFGLEVVAHPLRFLRSFSVRRWSERALILLVMQSHDNSLRVYRKRGLLGPRLASRQGHGEPSPTYIPVANEAARHGAEILDGTAMGSWGEVLLDVPLTAHIIGGATIGEDPATGVIDPYHRLYGHPGLHVADGSAISANLGANPALTITAMTERAMALWPNLGEADPRPPLGEPYRRLAPVPPRHPAVPDHAPAALRLPGHDGP